MADKTGIEWTDTTWNPIRGCTRVSAGCQHCYAESVAARFSGPGLPYEGLTKLVGGDRRWTGEVRLVEEALTQPLRWKRPRRIFVNSMSDLFHEAAPNAAIDRIFAVMALAPHHTFQILTKRPNLMNAYLTHEWTGFRIRNEMQTITPQSIINMDWPLTNVWLGVSVENQGTADERIPLLLAAPAAKRFISAEPLLGPVDLQRVEGVSGIVKTLTGAHHGLGGVAIGSGLDWVICGGESGPHARPMHPNWARSLRDQCAAAGVPFFFKQWGEWQAAKRTLTCSRARHCFDDGYLMIRVGKCAAGRLLDGREHKEFPA